VLSLKMHILDRQAAQVPQPQTCIT
jgi:hypothetical protein